MKTVLAHILLISLAPVAVLILLYWLVEGWWAGREIGGSQY